MKNDDSEAVPAVKTVYTARLPSYRSDVACKIRRHHIRCTIPVPGFCTTARASAHAFSVETHWQQSPSVKPITLASMSCVRATTNVRLGLLQKLSLPRKTLGNYGHRRAPTLWERKRTTAGERFSGGSLFAARHRCCGQILWKTGDLQAEVIQQSAKVLPQAFHELRKLNSAVLQHAERERKTTDSPNLVTIISAAELMRNNFDILEAISNIEGMRAVPRDSTVDLFGLVYKVKKVYEVRVRKADAYQRYRWHAVHIYFGKSKIFSSCATSADRRTLSNMVFRIHSSVFKSQPREATRFSLWATGQDTTLTLHAVSSEVRDTRLMLREAASDCFWRGK